MEADPSQSSTPAQPVAEPDDDYSKKLSDAHYKDHESLNEKRLCQGNLLRLDRLEEGLNAAGCKIREIYKYFFENYSHGIILNADCDILFEPGRDLKVRCVHLAAVVAADKHIQHILDGASNKGVIAVNQKAYSKIVTKFTDLINQQDKLYFFLPSCAEIGFDSPHIVRLDTSISIKLIGDDPKDRGRYEALLAARMPRTLKEPYVSKLGENYSDLFNRTGLTDVDELLGKGPYKKWLKSQLEAYFFPVDDIVHKRAEKELGEIQAPVDSPDYIVQVLKILEKYKDEVNPDFSNSDAYLELEKIITNTTKANVASGILKKIQSSTALKKALIEKQGVMPVEG